MKSLLSFLFFVFSAPLLNAQVSEAINGIVRDAKTREILKGTSITIFNGFHIDGIVTNRDGKFILPAGRRVDSLKFSMVGYHSQVLPAEKVTGKNQIEINLVQSPSILVEVLVKPSVALDIIRQSIAKIKSFLPESNFESAGFYREIIKDKEQYFSVAEAIFKSQYFPEKQSYKLKLERGRTKEDVAYTRLFEDYHPGGGPQAAIDNNFLVKRPDFLNPKKINNFNYKIEKILHEDDCELYCIAFDQKPDVKEALEKGRVYINAEDFSIVRYEAENSPAGSRYIKNLTGADKIFAEILNIDFKRKGWKRTVDFSKVNDKWFLSHANVEFKIGYKQPKKEIDLDLTINIEILMTDLYQPLIREIDKSEEWKRKNLVMNLPAAFDSTYWGNNNIISPTEEVKQIIASLTAKNHDSLSSTAIDGWQYLNKNLFVTSQHHDTIIMMPIMKSLWEEDQTSAMIYKNIQGDFAIESRLDISKTSDLSQVPDKGFQQAGIIIRNPDNKKENYLILSMGTGGNANPKIFFKKTIDNKTRTVANKRENMSGWLRIEKMGSTIAAFYKSDEHSAWEKYGEYDIGWLKGNLQIGLMVFANFPGEGPKAKPDIRAAFSQLKIDAI